ncbi:MAG: hypothetical protein KF861_19090, partial [Planctomycetaceae bacterium]|nr:hypothetical protein [Planctomycetaceae bacterium]
FDHYADAVDCVATHETALDALYHPGLDLTRIGRSDWCQCGFNRALCRCTCARCKPAPDIGEPPTDPLLGGRVYRTPAPVLKTPPVEKSQAKASVAPVPAEADKALAPYLPPPSVEDVPSTPPDQRPTKTPARPQ